MSRWLDAQGVKGIRVPVNAMSGGKYEDGSNFVVLNEKNIITVKNENLPELAARLKDLARAELGDLDLHPILSADMELPLSALTFDLLGELGQLEPTGYGNREAIFVSRNARVKSARVVGAEGRHLKMTLQDERGITTDAIGFRLGSLQPDLPARIDLACTLESNTYNGRTTLQLNVKDVRTPDAPT